MRQFISYEEIDQARMPNNYDIETIEQMVGHKITECTPATINDEDGYLIRR